MYTYKRFSENRTEEERINIYNQRIKDAIELYQKYHTEFVDRDCPFCEYHMSQEEAKEFAQERFHNTYEVVCCKHCNSLYVNPCPTQEMLNEYYMYGKCNELLEEVYKKRAKKKSSDILDSRVICIAKYIENIKKDEIKLLELGCSSGGFLYRLKEYLKFIDSNKKVRLVGVDTNRGAIESNTDQELELYFGTAEEFLRTTDICFDIVWHTELIEHIINPGELFQMLYKKMNKGAYMIFTTPNAYSLEMKTLSYNAPRPLAPSIFPPMHLNAFSTINVSHFAIKHGFSVVTIETPGEFDLDMLELQRESNNNEMVLDILKMDENTKGLVQAILAKTGGSSHMRCVLQK
ncbi:MAG: methyltransferase domain-containing protein [Lachnospiraceae bacterium]